MYRLTVIIDGKTYQSTITKQQLQDDLAAWLYDSKATTFMVTKVDE